MKLRTQLTIVITAFVAVLVAATGLILVLRDDQRDRATVDRALDAKVAAIQTAAARSGALPVDPTYAIRLVANGKVRSATGPDDGFPLPDRDGFTNVRGKDSPWRSLVTPLKDGARLQVLMNLADVQRRHDSNVLVVNLMIVLAALLAAAGSRWLGGVVTRAAPAPAQTDSLTAAAAALRDLAPGKRLPAGSPLAEPVNRLLDRAETPAAHPAVPVERLRAELENLMDNPDMPATQRHLILAMLLDEIDTGAARR